MHIEILVEDSSGAKLVEVLLPKLVGGKGAPHSWRVHAYKGIGRVPKNLGAGADPAKRILLDQLPRLLQGYGRTPGIDAVVVVLLDTDKWHCVDFLRELNALAARCRPAPLNILFRLAIEEVEAWYLGDRLALRKAFPRAKQDVLSRYVQDSACDTWELLADAVHPGARRPSDRRAGPCRGRSSTHGPRRSARCSILTTTSRPASASCATAFVGWCPHRHEISRGTAGCWRVVLADPASITLPSDRASGRLGRKRLPRNR